MQCKWQMHALRGSMQKYERREEDVNSLRWYEGSIKINNGDSDKEVRVR